MRPVSEGSCLKGLGANFGTEEPSCTKILGDFSAKKMSFFTKSNIKIKFLQTTSKSLSKKRHFSLNFSAKKN
jgi:hypothetical protein